MNNCLLGKGRFPCPLGATDKSVSQNRIGESFELDGKGGRSRLV